MAKKNKLTSKKALTMLQEGRVHGKKLTEKQMKFFGAVAGGEKPKRTKKKKK